MIVLDLLQDRHSPMDTHKRHDGTGHTSSGSTSPSRLSHSTRKLLTQTFDTRQPALLPWHGAERDRPRPSAARRSRRISVVHTRSHHHSIIRSSIPPSSPPCSPHTPPTWSSAQLT